MINLLIKHFTTFFLLFLLLLIDKVRQYFCQTVSLVRCHVVHNAFYIYSRIYLKQCGGHHTCHILRSHCTDHWLLEDKGIAHHQKNINDNLVLLHLL